MQTVYEGPEDLVEKMKSLSVSQDCSLGGECKPRHKPPQFKPDRSGGGSQQRVKRNIPKRKIQLFSLTCRLSSSVGEF